MNTLHHGGSIQPSLRSGLAAVAVTLLLAFPIAAQEKPVTISGVLFGDAYYVASHHDAEADGQSGFWIRRGYLTFDRAFSDAFSARLRFEVSQPGDFRSSETMEPFVKDAYLKWKTTPGLELVAGLSPSPTWETIERVWGYRSVEKTPADLQRLGSSRDLGVALLGRFGASDRYRWHVQVGNGSSTGSETNEGKKVSGAFAIAPTKETLVELYADREERPSDQDRTTLQAFAAVQRGRYRAGVQFVHQSRRTTDLRIASLFGVLNVRERIALLGRVDRNFDPNPEGDRIPYLPFATTSASTLYLLGVDYQAHQSVSIIPNVEVVQYDEDVETTIMPRITLAFTF